VWHAACVIPFGLPAGYMEHLRLVMDKNKQRAIGILLVLGSILVLMATWDLPENLSPQLQ